MPVLGDVDYSLRRYFVDTFLIDTVSQLENNIVVLDLGGRKSARRGAFDPANYDFRTVSANVVADGGVDVVTDAQVAAFTDSAFDAVICSEVLEHVRRPELALGEIHRILKPGGMAFLTAPFLFPVHGDPMDYGRYTETFWASALADAGFDEAETRIEPQGGYASVLVDQVVQGLKYATTTGPSALSRGAAFILKLAPYVLRRAPGWDARLCHPSMRRYTTGYAITAIRSRDA